MPTPSLRATSPYNISFRSPVTLALAVSAALLIFHNLRFWRETTAALWSASIGDSLFMASLFVVLLFVHASFLLLIPGKRLLQAVVATLFVIAAVAAYSADTYGTFIDREMMRNLFETDRREAAALLNTRFALYMSILGVLPAFLIWRVEPTSIGWRRQLLHRFGFVAGGLCVSAVLLFTFSSHFSSFLREHKSLRYLLIPGAAIQGTIQYARSSMSEAEATQLVDTTGATSQVAASAGSKPLLLFLVIGETARAANFQLGGYARATNPELAKLNGVYYFRNVTSCGTSTAISLPCMFSHLGREHFTVGTAGHTTNLMDALARAGIGIEWRDNNSGSKGVGARIKTVSYGAHPDTSLCNEESCYDEIMLEGLEQRLAGIKDDAVFVFHQIGSHGPSYARRYPKEFERFTPVCQTNELSRCSDQQIRNAYDNTILYTDHNLARQIAILQALSQRFDTALIYVSDHGESLGERGLYLHGAPYVFAPEEQKRVPFVLWLSNGYQRRVEVDQECLRSQLGKPFSHDNLYHTVLGAMGVRNAAYQAGMDMLAPCRDGIVGEADAPAVD